MKLPWEKREQSTGSSKVELPKAANEPSAELAAEATNEPSAEAKKRPKGYTPPKGRPTPKRHDQEVARGVIRDPNALTPAQQSQKRKELKSTMSKDEWKAYKKQERKENRARNEALQAKIDSGDERYLTERDRGPVRRYVRDWVDTRRFFNNYAMPAALVLLVIMLIGTWLPRVSAVLSLLSMLFILIILVEGIYIGTAANKAAKKKFPDADTGFGLGMYAFSRATQPRNWRTPKPQVALGTKV